MISYKDIIHCLNDFFFKPQPTESIALFRIVWGSLIALYFLTDVQNINDFYGPHAILSLNAVKEQFPYPHLNVFHLFNSSYSFVYIVLSIYGIAIFTTILGFYTRISLMTVLICMTSLHQRNIWVLSSSDLLLRMITLYLVFSPCGHSLSVDSILGNYFKSLKQPRDWAPWALRLIQIQISVVYLWTSWHKLKGNDWIDGTAVYYATRLESMKNVTLPYLMDSVFMIKVATWGTLLVEIALGVLLWVKEFRRPMILIGILFHLLIEVTMSIPFFELIMIALLLVFYTPKEVRVYSQLLFRSWKRSLQTVPIYPELKNKLIQLLGGSYAKN